MRKRISALGLLLIGVVLSAQPPAPVPTTPRVSTNAAAVSSPNPSPQDQVKDLARRVQELESPKSNGMTGSILAAVITSFGALIVALVGICGQWIAAKRNADIAAQEAGRKQRENILAFKTKQLERFYAPMNALLGQSLGLYDKLMHQLVQDQPHRYRKCDPKTDDDYRYEVTDADGNWRGFRLLDQLPAIRQNDKAFTIVTGIMRIGRKMSIIITNHAGLATDDSMNVLSEYMAHYAILNGIYRAKETTPYPPGWHTMGYYPPSLNKKIAEGYKALNDFLAQYAAEGGRTLETGTKKA